MPFHTGEPWVLMQPRLRPRDEVLRVTSELLWTPAELSELQLSVQVDDPVADELLSLRVSSPLRVEDVGAALRQLTTESLTLYRRSLNPFDDLL